MDTGTPWDSHDDNDTTQKRSHEELYTALNDHIGALIEDENTLVVVLSEMSRTPVVNGDDGKDHWPVTSALLFGAGIKPGIYGATTTGLEADKPAPLTGLPVDPLTGRVDEDNGLKIETEHFVAGILYAAGLGVDKINGVDGYLPGVDIYRAFKDETS
jgi:hypothetical protein